MKEALVIKTEDKEIMSKFSRNEVKKATLDYFNGDTLATEVWINKYCLKDSEGNLYEKTPDDMHKRLAREFARIEKKYPNPLSEEKIYNKIKKFKRIVPQGSPMSGIGNDFQVISISNCFVIGNDEEADSYGGIMKLDQELVQLQKRRAGVGMDLSFVRPENSPVKNSALTSTGVIPFMERFSNSTREVAQGGRRGALMETIHIKHPDSELFIDAKTIKGKVTGANVSVKIDDNFMLAVTQGTTYTTQFPIESNTPKVTKEINASKLWKKIIHNAWKSAEPGILFWDTIIRESIPDCYADLGFKTVATNPCGEITLCSNDSCRLLAINLFGYVINPFTKNAYFDWESFKEDVIIAERLMDDIVDLELEKINKILNKIDSDPESDTIKETERNLWENIKSKAEKGRRTGLGITGEGDMLAALAYTYGTDDANNFAEKVHKILKLKAYESSIIMAEERGAFPLYDSKREENNPFILRIKEEAPELWEKMQFVGRRNLALLTIAPTGCSHPESLVSSDSGFYKLSELANPNKTGFHEISRNVNVVQDTTTSIATKAFNNGFADTKKIITYSGIELESTPNHKYKIITENGKYIWKCVEDIEIGDMLVSRIGGYNNTNNAKLINVEPSVDKNNYWEFKLREITQPTEVTPDFAKFLGIFYGDGSVHKQGLRIHCNYDSEQINIVIDLVKKIFGIDVKSTVGKTCESVIISSKTILKFLETNGCLKQKAHLIEIPLVIRMSSKESILSFIEGYQIADGSQTNNTKYIDTVSKKMAQQLAIIYRGLGVNVKIGVYVDRENSIGDRPLYRVYEKGFGSIGFDKNRYIRKDNKEWLNLVRKHGNELFFDEVVDIYNSKCHTLDIEVPNKNMYSLNSMISHNSVSMMTQTTSGIENAFLIYYTRRRKINPSDKNTRIDFVDEQGDMWMEYPVFHHNFVTYLKANGYNVDEIMETYTREQIDELVKKSPYYLATSTDVDWVKKVEMQGMIQKHIDHSISVTVNLPKDVTEEIVSKVYETGWHSGCKGITIYREGSRDGVLISENDKKKKEEEQLFKDNHAPKRPKRLPADIIRFQNNHEKWIAVVGKLDDRPYEIFTGRLENGLSKLPNSLIECEIVKNKIEIDEGIKSSRYDIEYVDSNNEKQIHTSLNHTFNPEFWNYAKMISSVLRHGMPLLFVVELIQSLNLDDSHLNTWKAGVTRVLKKYVKDGKTNGTCPNCGSESLEYIEGCLTCRSCGSGNCG